MAERLHPGVYIEEKPGAPAPIQGVSTSGAAFIGYTLEGPVDDPTIVTSFSDFKSQFGDFTADSLVPTSVFAFFKNGGKMATIVRTLMDDAEKAKTYLSETVSNEVTGVTGDGAETDASITTDHSPVRPGSLSLTYKIAGALVNAENIGTGDTVTATFDDTLASHPMTNNNVVISWTSGGNPKTQTIDSAGVVTGDGTAKVNTTVNRTTGVIHLDATGAIPDALAITVAYYPVGATKTVTDDGAGALAGDATGTIDYATGEIEAAFTTAPYSGNQPTMSYGRVSFEFDMKWPGEKGNDYRISLSGANGFEDADTASFTRFRLTVEKLNADGDYEVKETFDELVLTDSADADYIATVVNDSNAGSNLISIVTTGYDVAPTSLAGESVSAEAIDFAFDGAGKSFSVTLANPVAETTLSITITHADTTTTTITDDGDGGLDATGTLTLSSNGTNEIDYETGEVTVTFTTVPLVGETSTATYYAAPDETTHSETLSGGDDGAAVTRAAISAPALEADMRGLYALNKTDDMLTIVIPDFETDPTVMGEAIDYAENRKDRFVIVFAPEGLSPQEAKNWRKRTLNKNSSYYACYYPHITILDPVTQKALNVSGGGHIAGIFARTDSSKNVGKAPAGMQDGQILFSIGLERNLTFGEVDILNPDRVNALIDNAQTGRVVWGARTGETGGEFGYIQTRRLFIYVEKSVFNAAHIHVFENNGSKLWNRIKLQLSSFLSRLFNEGYFRGDTPADAYFVTCDSSNNPPASVDAGLLFVDVGIAANKPAEFIVFSFQNKQQG